MILSTSSEVINFMVKNKLFGASSRAIDAIISKKLDTEDPDIETKILSIVDEVTEKSENTPAILADMRIALGLSWDDTSKDKYINTLPIVDALERLLAYEGIVGYSHKIMNWIEELKRLQAGTNSEPRTSEF